MKNLNLIFAGSGAFGLPTLKALQAAGHTFAAIYTQPDRPAGRGKKLTPTPIAQYCDQNSLAATRTPNINLEPLPPADAMVVIAFGQKISQAVITHTPLQAINLHASLLPKYRGAAPIQRALIAGETITGNSIIRLADKMDAGKVLATSHLQILPTETAAELHDRLALDGAPLILQTLAALASGTATETDQDHSLATHAAKISRADCTLDFSQPAHLLSGQIRGLSPWPACRVALSTPDHQPAARFAILRCQQVPDQLPPATFTCQNHRLFVGTARDCLEILDIQPDNARPMPVASYLNGHPLPPTGHVVSVL
jgi:methionyl-tRNA formyltransferase